jgi:hypothetical protein
LSAPVDDTVAECGEAVTEGVVAMTLASATTPESVAVRSTSKVRADSLLVI